MAGSKQVVCACIMIFLVISSQADARRLMMAATCDGKEGACKGGVAVEGDGSGAPKQEMVSAASTEQPGEGMPMTTDSRPTAPGNSPGIGNRGKINN